MGTFGRTCASSASLRLLALVDVPICTPPRARIARLASETPARPHMNSANFRGRASRPVCIVGLARPPRRTNLYASSASHRPPRIRTVLRARSGWRSASLRLTTDNRTLVSPVGIEPTTNWLKASCSTTELRALLRRSMSGRLLRCVRSRSHPTRSARPRRKS
jgi:hypothetical protein